MTLPLDGVRVLDLTNALAGPYCTMVLGDLGARVTKIERIPSGDASRRFTPLVNGESYCFAMLNRNKESLAIDMKSPRGRDILLRLARQADIVVENFRPGVTKRLGLDDASLRATNPDLIYASLSGFGQTGPYGHKGGYDIIAQGMSGIMLMTGPPGGRPAKVGIAMNDIAGGATALWSILGAYIGRLRGQGGRYLETSLLEAGLAWSFWEAGAYFGAGEEPSANGTRHRRSAPYQAFKTADGYVTVGANGEKLWRNFCTEVCEKPEWLDDERFSTGDARLEHVDELEQHIEAVFATAPTSHWVERLDAAGVPGGPVYSYAQALDDPHIRARNMVIEIDHPVIGAMQMLGVPVKSNDDLAEIRKPAPCLGEHTVSTLSALGYGVEDIRAFVDDGVVLANDID